MGINKSSQQKRRRQLPKGYVTPEKAEVHARTLSSSVKKKYRHLSKRFKREGLDCFRLYDWDSPDIRVVVDWYAGHVVIAEYERLQTGADYLPLMAKAVAGALNVPLEKIHLKRRHTNVTDGPRYSKIDSRGERFEVHERDLRFWVNLGDYLDTGLYSDHRETRVIIRNLAQGRDFLNLFAYTGAFTCAAAAAGARSTVSVDRAQTYLDWIRENLVLNGLWSSKHTIVRSDVMKFISKSADEGRKFNLAFVDPPSFYKDEKDGVSFDINRDHPLLIKNVIKLLTPGADLLFSTNHQRFEPRFEGLKFRTVKELSPQSIPEDYRNRKVHRCWQFVC
jgi:23S rRNA (cytosine1962-C5)-methyltransferase